MGLLKLIAFSLLLGSLELQAAPLGLRPSSASTNSTNAPISAETPSEAPQAEEEEVRAPEVEKVMRATLPAAHTPATYGTTQGTFWIAQRTMVEDYCGWGWVKKESDTWRQARWVALEANPKGCPIPNTFLPRPEDDKNCQYRFYGEFAPYRAYEPQADVWIDVFLLKGFVSLGPVEPLRREPPANGSSRPNRFAERGANLRAP